MPYELRTVIIIPLSLTDDANQLAAALTGNDADALTFGRVLLSADGNEPATHTMCSTLLQLSMTGETGAFFTAHPEARWWSWANAPQGIGPLIAAWDGEPRAADFDWSAALAEVALMRIEPDVV